MRKQLEETNTLRQVIKVNGKVVKQCWTVGDLNYLLPWSNAEVMAEVLKFRKQGILAYAEIDDGQWQ